MATPSATEETAEEASLRQLLRQKLQGQVDLFNTEHLQILLDRGLNSEELLPTATWKDLFEDPALPEGLLVQLLQAYNAGELLGFNTHKHARIVLLLKNFFDALDEPEARLSELDNLTVWQCTETQQPPQRHTTTAEIALPVGGVEV